MITFTTQETEVMPYCTGPTDVVITPSVPMASFEAVAGYIVKPINPKKTKKEPIAQLEPPLARSRTDSLITNIAGYHISLTEANNSSGSSRCPSNADISQNMFYHLY